MSRQDGEDGEPVPVTVAHPNSRVTLTLPFPAEPFDLIRREK